MDILLNVDQLTSYRKFQIETFMQCAKKSRLILKILANTKNTRNLNVLKEYTQNQNFIKSEPINLFKYCIWQPRLITNILKRKPKLVIMWGEVTRLNSWIVLILKRLNLIKSEITLWTHAIYGRENIILKHLRLFHLSLSDFILVYNTRSKNLLIKN